MESYVNILKVEKKNNSFLAFSKDSVFYPDGKGGQLGDRGMIGPAKVLKVFQKEDFYVCEIDKPIAPGKHQVVIDIRRQKFIAQHHTGQHILSASLIEIADIPTVSFHMGEDYSTIDLDIPFIVDSVLKEVEDKSNELIQACIPVEILTLNKEDANKLPLRKRISEKVKEPIRIVKIDNFDYSPCGGYHVKNTGEIGLIKILKTEKVKGNLTRLYFVAGNKALEYFYEYNRILRKLSQTLTSSISELIPRTEKLLSDVKTLSAKIDALSEEIAKTIAKDLAPYSSENIFFCETNETVARFIPKHFGKKDSLLIIFDGNKYHFTSTNTKMFKCGKIIRNIVENFGGKGGGNDFKGTYIFSKTIHANHLIDFIKEHTIRR
ncbi:alanyl-tRNA editing protein [Thermosipho ferrireducens]|uniref:Alanyl-tRNA editing protein n=1 Tax=Thermosipho ferrireducens TaxID=2571116 RepID=A0ABX7SAV1_9BACT|nr:alanyl-tRNA editing protein [Thermosipho ferrireducens]QTA38581.1 alanyl-tRNA editing protein [Thermosipho ferrireducens]